MPKTYSILCILFRIFKWTGLDLKSCFLRSSAVCSDVALTNINNGKLRFILFPRKWKLVTSVGIPKPRKYGRFPQNYYQLNTLSNVIEKAVLNLLSFSSSIKAISKQQFRFELGHFLVNQLPRVVELIVDGFSKNKFTGFVYPNVSKAFDKV